MRVSLGGARAPRAKEFIADLKENGYFAKYNSQAAKRLIRKVEEPAIPYKCKPQIYDHLTATAKLRKNLLRSRARQCQRWNRVAQRSHSFLEMFPVSKQGLLVQLGRRQDNRKIKTAYLR